MRRMIFHIPNTINKNLASGSQIRPLMMLTAFKQIGYEVDVVMGNVKERRENIKLIEKNIKEGVKYSFLYSESSTVPTALTEPHHLPIAPFLDFNFFKFCKKNEIKIGLFYRDIYWVFDEYKNEVPFLKKMIATFFYKYDLYQYTKIIDVFYLPSKIMYKYVPIDFNCNVINLPPASSNINIQKKSKNSNQVKVNFVYVGGISSLYDIKLFLNVVNEIGENSVNLCVRQNEWEKNKENYNKYLNILKIHHKKGEKLSSIYNDSKVAIYFVKPQEIWSFAIGVKLFEYLAYLKPIIAVKGTAVGEFVEQNDIGWVIPYEEVELRKLLLFINNNPQEIENKIKNIEKIAAEHTWEARAKQVEKNLSQ